MRNLLFSLLMAVASLASAAGEALVSLNAKDEPLKSAVAVIKAQSGARFFLPERLADRKVTVAFQALPLSEAVEALAKAAGIFSRPGRNKDVFILTDRK